MRKSILITFMGVAFLLGMNACYAPTKAKSAKTTKENPEKTVAQSTTKASDQVHQSVADILRRTPGLQIMGRGDNISIMVRGTSTINGSGSPIFVVDGNILGDSYATVSGLNVNDIQSVTVLKDVASTSSYGMQGAFGVIEIRTKRPE